MKISFWWRHRLKMIFSFNFIELLTKVCLIILPVSPSFFFYKCSTSWIQVRSNPISTQRQFIVFVTAMEMEGVNFDKKLRNGTFIVLETENKLKNGFQYFWRSQIMSTEKSVTHDPYWNDASSWSWIKFVKNFDGLLKSLKTKQNPQVLIFGFQN